MEPDKQEIPQEKLQPDSIPGADSDLRRGTVVSEPSVSFVWVDSGLADLRSAFEIVASALFERSVVCRTENGLHSLRRLATSAGLSRRETEEIVNCISNVPDFWLTLRPIEGAVFPRSNSM